jgi:hypothetical protein
MVQFSVPLSAALPSSGHVIYNAVGATSTHCSGKGHADPGYLCVYSTTVADVGTPEIFEPETATVEDTAGPHGFVLVWVSTAAGNGYDGGAWTVTAP